MRAEGLYDKAIVAFRLILVNHPELIRVRLELARTFFLKGQGRVGAATLRAGAGRRGAAAGGGINIHAFLNVMQARKRWTGYFGAAFAPDSNLNAASESEIVYIDTVFGRLPFQREGDFGAQSGFGVSVWGGGEYQQPLSERLRLRVGADLAVREYPGERFRSDISSPRTSDRAGWPARGPRSACWPRRSASGSVAIPYADEFGVRLELDRRLTSRILGARHRGVPRARSPAAATFSTARWSISPPLLRGRRRRYCACT